MHPDRQARLERYKAASRQYRSGSVFDREIIIHFNPQEQHHTIAQDFLDEVDRRAPFSQIRPGMLRVELESESDRERVLEKWNASELSELTGWRVRRGLRFRDRRPAPASRARPLFY